MNKKFITLLASGLMLASFGASADNFKTAVESQKFYAIGIGIGATPSGYLSIGTGATPDTTLVTDAGATNVYVKVDSTVSAGGKGLFTFTKADGKKISLTTQEGDTYDSFYVYRSGGYEYLQGVGMGSVFVFSNNAKGDWKRGSAVASTAISFGIGTTSATPEKLNKHLGSSFMVNFTGADGTAVTPEAAYDPISGVNFTAVPVYATAPAATKSLLRVSGNFKGFTSSAATKAEFTAFMASEFLTVDTVPYSKLNASALQKSFVYKVVKGSEFMTVDATAKKIYANSKPGGSSVLGLGLNTTDYPGYDFVENNGFAAPKVKRVFGNLLFTAEIDAANGTVQFASGDAYVPDPTTVNKAAGSSGHTIKLSA